jgi:hypothetical protein
MRLTKELPFLFSSVSGRQSAARPVEPVSSVDKVRLCLTASLTRQAFPPAQLATQLVFLSFWLLRLLTQQAFTPCLLSSSNFGTTLFVLKFVQQLLVLSVGATSILLKCIIRFRKK